jgi:DNA-binding Lrp family transcriptional regulator
MEILAHLKKGPKTADELVKLVNVSRKTLYKRVKDLVGNEEILVFPILVNNHWVSLYSLPEHKELAVALSGYIPVAKTSGMEKKVIKAIEELKFRLCRNPDVTEIALELGEDPEDRSIRSSIYRVGTKIKWRPPLEEERRRGEKERDLVIELATLIKKGYLEAIKGKPSALVKKAREYLKRYPDIIP